MNIVLATDDNFVQHCGTTIRSIMSHNKDVHFYILTEGLTKENKTLLTNLTSTEGSDLEFCIVPSDVVKYFPMSKMASNHISIATYYRLFVTTLLPNNIDKIIYLDCDMIIRDSLEEMWETELEGAPLAAVYQHLEWSDNNNTWERLSIPREYGYFNAGCLLLNLDYLRKIGFQNKAIEFINSNFDRIISHDQDVLNALFYDKAIVLPCKWNYLPIFWKPAFNHVELPSKCLYRDEKADKHFDPIIIHFVSKPKPWNYGCDNPYTSEYFKYLSQTPWKEFTVTFTFREFYKFKLIPFTKRMIKKMDVLNIVGFAKSAQYRID